MSRETVGRPMEILLVEDSLIQARLTFHAMDQANFEHRISMVRDGQQALEFLQKVGKYARVPDPDIVLLDLRLPKVDGLEVLKQIKQDETLQQIPVVIMTGSEKEADRLQCQAANVDAYLTKPMDVPKFLDVIEQLREFWRHGELVLPTSV